jgi:hypothetical protein
MRASSGIGASVNLGAAVIAEASRTGGESGSLVSRAAPRYQANP